MVKTSFCHHALFPFLYSIYSRQEIHQSQTSRCSSPSCSLTPFPARAPTYTFPFPVRARPQPPYSCSCPAPLPCPLFLLPTHLPCAFLLLLAACCLLLADLLQLASPPLPFAPSPWSLLLFAFSFPFNLFSVFRRIEHWLGCVGFPFSDFCMASNHAGN